MNKHEDHSFFSFCSKNDLLLYIAISPLAFSRCVFLGQAYFDNDLLAQFGPWRAFLKDQLAQGHFPLWNPYLMGGQPFFADLQNMMLYPLNWLTLPFSVPYGLSLFFLIHMFWAALGMHLWLNRLGLSHGSCRSGALLFALSNFFWLELIHPPVIAAFAWLPWLFAALETLSKTPGPRQAFSVGFSFAMLSLCGCIQVTVGAFYAGLAYYIFRVWVSIEKEKPKPVSRRLRTYVLVGLMMLWGALPLLGQLIPTYEFSALCDRSVPNQTYDQFNAKLPLNPATLYQFLFPRFTLPPDKTMAEAIQFGNTNDETRMAANLGYLGVWLPFLAFAAFQNRNKKISWFFLSFLIIALAVCFGRYTPFHRMICAALPGFSIIRVPYRFLYLYVLAASALAAFGWEALSLADSKIRLKGPLIFAALLYFAALFRAGQTWREILGLTLGVIAFFVWKSGTSQKKYGLLLFQAALIAPLFLNGWGNFVPGPASNFDFAKNSRPFLEAVERIKPYRVLFFNTEMGYPIEVSGRQYILNYPQDAACALKIKNFGGYNPLMLQAKKETGSIPLKPLLQFGAIRGILANKDHDIPGFKQQNLTHYHFYEYQGPLSYAYVPGRLQVIPDPAQRLALMQKPDFDLSQEVILSEPLPSDEMAAFQKPGPVQFKYQLDLDEPDSQRFTVHLDRASLAVFSEVMFPGWKVMVDGKPKSLLTADHLLRAIFLEAGNHQVDFRFQPSWWEPIQIGLVLWISLTFLGFIFFKFFRKKISHA